MKEELHNDQNENEPKPGTLGNSFDAFQPAMPSGSWERLEERRKKKSRLPFWWLPLLFVAGLGLSVWVFTDNSLKNIFIESVDIQVIDVKKGVSTMPESKSETHKENEEVATSDNTNSNESSAKANNDINKNVAIKPTKSKRVDEMNGFENQIVESKKPLAFEKPNPLAGKQNTKGVSHLKNVPNTMAFVNSDHQERNAKTSKGVDRLAESGVFLNEKDPSNSKKIAQESGSGFESTKSRIELKEKKPEEIDETIEIDGQENASVPPIENRNIPDNQSEKANSGALQPQEAKQEKTPTIATFSETTDSAKASSRPNLNPETVVKTDSNKALGNLNWKERIEVGFTAFIVNQNVSIPVSILSNAETSINKIANLTPLWGGSATARLKIPISKRWSLYPMVELAIQTQSVQYLEKPGASAPIKLIKTDQGIVGNPLFTERTYWKTIHFFLPSAGLEASFELNRKISFRTGFSFAWYFDVKMGSAQIPTYAFATQYQLKNNFFLRTELKFYDYKKPFAGVEATSRNLQLGLGLVWKLKY